MTANTVSVKISLNRWHKVVERLNELRSAAHSKMLANSVVRESVQAVNLYDKRHAEASAKALEARQELATVITTIGVIRQALQKSNVQLGISDRLSEMETIRYQAQAVTELIALLETTNSLEDAKVLAAARLSQNDAYASRSDIQIYAIPDDIKAGLEAESIALSVRKNNLADEISELNTTRLEITLDESLAKRIGLV